MTRHVITLQLFDQLALTLAAVLGSCTPASAPKLRTASNFPSAAPASPAIPQKPGSPRSDPNLAECRMEHSGPGITILHCGSVDLKVTRSLIIGIDGILLLADFSNWKREEIDLGGISYPGAIRTGGTGRFGIVVAVAAEPASDSRYVFCVVDQAVSTSDADCRKAIKSLVVTGALARVTFAAPSLRVGTRELAIPSGCDLTPSNQIRCPHAILTFHDSNPSCDATADDERQGLEKNLARTAQVNHTTIPCVVLDESQTCDKFERPEHPSVMTIASLHGCALPRFFCTMYGAGTDNFPEPCNQVFSGKP